MAKPIIAGTDEQREELFDGMAAIVDPDAGKWVQCPDCGSDNAAMIWWERSDMNYHCGDCESRHGIR